ncbi:MAG: hypothetical protein IJS52_10105 [Bacilli bacterium]|nr:hypothetical protein [Bacilli bacterium]
MGGNKNYSSITFKGVSFDYLYLCGNIPAMSSTLTEAKAYQLSSITGFEFVYSDSAAERPQIVYGYDVTEIESGKEYAVELSPSDKSRINAGHGGVTITSLTIYYTC